MGKNMDDLKGRMEEAIGDITDNKDMKRSGKIDRAAGQTKEKVRQAGKHISLDEDKVEEKIDDMKDAAHEKFGKDR